jgi:hypothetical protein
VTAYLDDRQPSRLTALVMRFPEIFRISPLVLVLSIILVALVAPPALFLLKASVHETLPDGSAGEFTLRF